MATRIKHQRRPIRTEVNGTPVTLLTIGHCARALHRSTATIKSWERIGLFPPAPFWQRPNGTPAARRRLYPLDFVKALPMLGDRYKLGKRLDREQWQDFHDAVVALLAKSLAPLIPQGQEGSQVLQPDGDAAEENPQAM